MYPSRLQFNMDKGVDASVDSYGDINVSLLQKICFLY